ncbi:hypothetical protein [Rhodococcoides fascians]|uniref:hypothetical protein n=1 Tax=Rhodococcoides fascians TaxID=1828 RepID=UPI000AE1A670|nr:hypothetical protein [Rhodococcus fascians]
MQPDDRVKLHVDEIHIVEIVELDDTTALVAPVAPGAYPFRILRAGLVSAT